jgi:hypothetical protein
MQRANPADRNVSDGQFSRDFAAIPEDIVSQRRGEVLLKHTILKSDHFPGEAMHQSIHLRSGIFCGAALDDAACISCTRLSKARQTQSATGCHVEHVGCQNKTLTDQLPGAPNFCQVQRNAC